MARYIEKPTVIEAAGNKPKSIFEFVGGVNTATDGISIAQMNSPEGWEEPGQTPEFTEYTLVLEGCLVVETHDETFEINVGQAMIIEQGEWVRYSSPFAGGAKYIAVCVPAFSVDRVHRDT
jgi:mannose-6-phosphate isomerase-like protein (cupin superfamily)